MSKNNLITRSITGLIFIAIVISSIFLHTYIFAVLFLLVTLIGIGELLNASKFYSNISINKVLAYVSGGVTYLIISANAQQLIETKWLLLIILLLPIIMIFELYRKKSNPFLNIAYTFLPTFYIAIPLGILNYMQIEANGKILLAFFVTIWASDTFAYCVGTLMGKHRLFERISPKKSWEGSIGSAIITIGISLFYNQIFGELNMWQWSIFALIAIVTATFGDLVESLFKRSVEIKDSGNILPGHGGILDRFDAVLLSSPFIFVFLQIIK